LNSTTSPGGNSPEGWIFFFRLQAKVNGSQRTERIQNGNLECFTNIMTPAESSRFSRSRQTRVTSRRRRLTCSKGHDSLNNRRVIVGRTDRPILRTEKSKDQSPEYHPELLRSV
jgi:hypothetical protein